jgi:hypothetical protein
MVAIAPITSTSTALADSNPLSNPSPDPFKGSMDQYRIDRENYLNAMKMRNFQIRAINNDFKNACDSAALAFKNAMSVAKTPDAKNAAIAARKNAISAAIVARDTSIAALGAEPIAPIEPIKPMKASKSKSR